MEFVVSYNIPTIHYHSSANRAFKHLDEAISWTIENLTNWIGSFSILVLHNGVAKEFYSSIRN